MVETVDLHLRLADQRSVEEAARTAASAKNDALMEIVNELIERRLDVGNFRAKEIEVTGIGPVFLNPFFAIVGYTVRFPGGNDGVYWSMRDISKGRLLARGGAAVVLPVLEDGRFVLIRNYRHGLRSWVWETPRGSGDFGETPTAAAARESTKEAALFLTEQSEARVIGVMNARTDMYFNDCALVVLTNVRFDPSATLGEDTEGISEARAFTPAEGLSLLAGQDVVDSYTYTVLLQAILKGEIRGASLTFS